MRTLWMALPLLLCLCAFSITAQEAKQDAEQEAEPEPQADQPWTLHIAAPPSDLVVPFRDLARRVAEMEGIDSAAPLHYRAHVASLQVTTELSDEQLAAVLGCEVFWVRGRELMVGVASNPHARRAEARQVIREIAGALFALVDRKSSRDQEVRLPFEAEDPLPTKLTALGLSPAILNGRFYTESDFHMEAEGRRYTIWAGGTEFLSRSRPGHWFYDEWYEDFTEQRPLPQQGEHPAEYVGASGGSWSRLEWRDTHARNMDRDDRGRDKVEDDKLVINRGAEIMASYLSQYAAMLYMIPNETLEQWETVFRHNMWEFEDSDWTFSAWSLRRRWQEGADGTRNLHAWFYSPGHEYYLLCKVDMSTALEAALDNPPEGNEPQKVDVSDYLTWIVGPEPDAGIFDRYRADARVMVEAMSVALAATPGLSRSGKLDDAELVEALGLAVPELQEFKAGDFELFALPFGYHKLFVGDYLSGGSLHAVFDAAGKLVAGRLE